MLTSAPGVVIWFGKAKHDMETYGYLAFIDLLGFSNMVSRPDFGAKWNAFLAIVNEAIGSSTEKLQYAIASDSIILTTGADQY